MLPESMSPTHCEERPFKRQRIQLEDSKLLPPDILLLSLPHLIRHPPTHKHHSRSLFLSLHALRKCLSLPDLEPVIECRAWTELAEVGLRIGLDEPGIEAEVSKAVTKALTITTKHPSLRLYKPQLTYVSARLAAHQNNAKMGQTALKKILTQFLLPSDPPHIIYTAHLAHISSQVAASSHDEAPLYSPASASLKALSSIHDLHDVARRRKHPQVALLAKALELRDLVQNGAWSRVDESLQRNERALNISLETNPAAQNDGSHPPAPPIPKERTKLETVLIVHVLIIGVLFFTYIGNSERASARLKQLHDLLDGGALDAFGPDGIVEVNLPDSPPLLVQVTHPRVIFTLGFLVSSIAKRDPVGRKPKRRMFANEGILVVDKELKKEIQLPPWASLADVKAFQDRMYKMKADMICELVGLCISRSEFSDAERHLTQLIAHTRTCKIFSLYSARITLHHAHLAHSLGQSERALQCYQVAALLSSRWPAANKDTEHPDEDGCEDYWVNVSARAGEIWLRTGLAADEENEEVFAQTMKLLRKKGEAVAKECEGLGGALQAIGAVLTAVLSTEFLVNKTELRNALNLTTAAQDNHLRALVLALVAGQYLHTSTEHATAMLSTCEQIVAGLGAQPKSVGELPRTPQRANALPGVTAGEEVGNAPLRLWIGERNLELKRRTGDEEGVVIQEAVNKKLMAAVARVHKRKLVEVE